MAGTHMEINLMGPVTLTSGFEPPRVESKTAKAHCNFSLQSLSRSQLRVDRVEIDGADSARPRAHMLPIWAGRLNCRGSYGVFLGQKSDFCKKNFCACQNGRIGRLFVVSDALSARANPRGDPSAILRRWKKGGPKWPKKCLTMLSGATDFVTSFWARFFAHIEERVRCRESGCWEVSFSLSLTEMEVRGQKLRHREVLRFFACGRVIFADSGLKKITKING